MRTFFVNCFQQPLTAKSDWLLMSPIHHAFLILQAICSRCLYYCIYCIFSTIVRSLLNLVTVCYIPAALTFPVHGLMPQNLHNSSKIRHWWKWGTVKPTFSDKSLQQSNVSSTNMLLQILIWILQFLYQFLNLLQCVIKPSTSVQNICLWLCLFSFS